ncbi:SGNH/GDSL hydrolase family protein [Bacillus sp. B15-48]|uniref:SGNH/GDSL hydrolase family protein n=1 Tax=Bacillus sp. B15-48 TaxID=1548601 RepID=UPI00193EFE24|nr:SGNH/GDSL hydrolase family protein [Bacillus sp. B15-48]MBM4761472.1 hypothetical protein [Bacillus sp. B15-48]
MKYFLVTLLAIGCTAILIFGSIHYKDKTSVSAENEAQTATGNGNQSVKTEDTKQLERTANWPALAQEHYEQTLAEERPFTILLAGSQVLDRDENSPIVMLKQALEETYDETIEVVIKTYEATSAQFIAQGRSSELTEVQPDLTLLEPFALNDNGEVRSEDSQQHLATIAARLTEANPNHVLIIQPPYPLYQATFYPLEVAAIKTFAEQRNIPYLDHWTAWPDASSEELLTYVEEGKPTLAGQQLWSEFLIDYFISK